jgi:hypothetical protein
VAGATSGELFDLLVRSQQSLAPDEWNERETAGLRRRGSIRPHQVGRPSDRLLGTHQEISACCATPLPGDGLKLQGLSLSHCPVVSPDALDDVTPGGGRKGTLGLT